MNRTVIKNTSMLYVMNIAKMIFPLITLPYLTRVLSVECFGLVAYVKAVMQYMQILVDFGFMLSGTKDVALIRDDKKKLSVTVCDVLAARIIVSIVALIILSIMNNCILILVDNLIFSYLSFAVVFLSCFFMDYLFRGLEIMEFITVRFVLMKGIATGLTFFMVKSDSDILWIPMLDIFGSLFAIALVWKQIFNLGISVKLSSIQNILFKIKESAIYFASEVSTTAFGALNTLVIGICLPEVQVAYWSVCQQLVGGVQSLYTPITSSIYPQMIKNKDINLIIRIVKLILPILFIGCMFTYFVADYVVTIVAGIQYLPAGDLLRYLIPVMFFGFFSMLYGWPVLGAIGKQREVTFTTIIAAIFQTSGLILLYVMNSFTLVSIAILRCITECILFTSRFIYYSKFKSCFTRLT